MVVFPEPETPVTTVSLPWGMATSKGFTVWMAPVAKRMTPRWNRSFSAARWRTSTWASPVRKGPIWEAGQRPSSSTVPWATTWPPLAPASGPISSIQSASRKIWVSWSTSSTEFREPGTAFTHCTSWERDMAQAWSREMPRSLGARAASLRRVPWQSGQVPSIRNFSTRFMPFSSFTLARAFSTV